MSKMKYKNLLGPIRVNKLILENKMVMAPMGTQLARPDGSDTEHLIDFLEERAKGGVGTIITEYSFIDNKYSKSSANQLGCHCDAMVPGLNRLVESVKPYGTRIFLQICHAGIQADKNLIGHIPLGPSTIIDETGEKIAEELSCNDIDAIIEMFALAVKRAKQAGFDGVEIHGAHGYYKYRTKTETIKEAV